MKVDLSLIDCLRMLIDFTQTQGRTASQTVLLSLLEDVSKAIEREPLPIAANLATAPLN